MVEGEHMENIEGQKSVTKSIVTSVLTCKKLGNPPIKL